MAAENNLVGEVGLLVKPVDPNAQFNRGVDKIIKQLERQAEFQVKAAGLQEIQQQANQAGQAFAQAAIQAAGFTAAVFAMRAAVEGAIGKLSGLFDQLAKAQAGFTSILRSEAAGQSLLDDIREFARISPFVTQELVNYSQQLLGVGVSAEKIVPLLEDVGNIVSSVGGDTQNIGRVLFTLTQIQSIGRLAGQDAMQLQSALIPITKYLSEYLGKTTAEVKKLQEQGAISADTVFAAISAQGDKVQGAMASATRNISGARAVLSDTITIMFQNQEVLERIFTDVYKGILTVSNALGSAEFQNAFNKFFDNVGQVYDELRPFITELAEIGGQGGMLALGQFGTALGILADTLAMIPTPVLEMLARVFAAMATLKAPLMLIQYVQSLQRMAVLLPQAATGMSRLGAAAGATVAPVNAQATALEKVNAALAKRMNLSAQTGLAGFLGRNGAAIGAIGGAAAGSYLSESGNDNIAALGGALTYGSIGLALGGPAGAAAGAAYGAFTSYANSAETRAREHVEKMRELGVKAAEGFLTETKDAYNGQLTGGLSTDIEQRIRIAQRDLAIAQEAARGSGQSKGDFLLDSLAFGGVFETGQEQNANNIRGYVANIQSELDALQSENIALFEPIKLGLQDILPLLERGQEGFMGLTQRGGRGGPRSVETDLEKVEETLKGYNLTLEDITQKTPEAIAQIIRSFDGLTTAQREATLAATEFNTAYKDAAAAAASIFDPQQQKLSTQLGLLNAQNSAYSANLAAGADPTDQVKRMTAELEALKVQETAVAMATAQGLDEKQAATAGERAYSEAIYARTIGMEQAAMVSRMTSQVQIDKIIELANIADTLENRELVIDIVTRGLEQAKADMEEARLWAAGGRFDIQGGAGGIGTGGGSFGPPNVKSLAEQAADAVAQREAEALAEEQKRLAEEAARKAQEWADSVVSATDNMTTAVEDAAQAIKDAADSWIASIKERVQYEQAVSAGRLIRNTERQIGDLGELSTGIDSLRARGVTDEVLRALGIDNVADVRQVRKLVNASDADLAKLTGLVGTLNSDAVALATKEEDDRTQKNIEQGIIAAATALGYTVGEAKATAAQILPNFNITTASSPEEVAMAIIGLLTAGRTGL